MSRGHHPSVDADHAEKVARDEQSAGQEVSPSLAEGQRHASEIERRPRSDDSRQASKVEKDQVTNGDTHEVPRASVRAKILLHEDEDVRDVTEVAHHEYDDEYVLIDLRLQRN